MIGAIRGTREPAFRSRPVAASLPPRGGRGEVGGKRRLLALALVFVWAGIEFRRFAWNRFSELAELALWMSTSPGR